MPNAKPPSRTSIRTMYLWGLLLSLLRLAGSRVETFRFDDEIYKYFSHNYNLTWMNERYVEVAIGLAELKARDPSQILEVGNVLSHYLPEPQHTIVDKYEKGKINICNVDAIEFKPDRTFEFIISLSTFEHIGWDELPQEPDKSWETIKYLSSLLAPGGEFLFTVPVGYHKQLDNSILQHFCHLGPLKAMRRVSASNKWIQCSTEDAATCSFGKPYPFANAIFLAKISSPLPD